MSQRNIARCPSLYFAQECNAALDAVHVCGNCTAADHWHAMLDRPNHGLQCAYEFGLNLGGMERSSYFGLLRDLYHFDHFMAT